MYMLYCCQEILMLAKLTRGNQITIPKQIMRQAHLKEGKDYLDVSYDDGVILLKPVEIEERVPPKAYEKLLSSAFTQEPGDLLVSDKDAGSVLPKRSRKR